LYRSLRVLFVKGSIALRSDAELVRLLLEDDREAAFEALIARYGPMVLGVCRRILRDEHAAEDTFQAVFLILARKAESIRVEDSLGRWLYGVCRRVAVRAKAKVVRQIPEPLVTCDHLNDPAVEAVRAESRHLVGLEVARLPRKYRETVALYYLDGLTHEETANALAIPVGTVRSRLSRARDLLRTRFIRRGLAPALLASWLESREAAASVSWALLKTTLRNTGGVPAAVAVPPTVLVLANHTMRSFMMTKALSVIAVAATLASLTTGAALLVRGDDGPTKAPTQSQAAEPTPATPSAKSPELEEQYRRIIAEFEEAKKRALQASSVGKSEYERWEILSKESPEDADYARRMIDLAAAHPKETASRDALIWVINKPYRADAGAYGDEFSRAVNLLVDHHADDPEVARLGLGLDNVLSRRRDAFLEGIYANAKGREAKGLARLALAMYLEKKATFIPTAHKLPVADGHLSRSYDERGELVEKKIPFSNEFEGYRQHVRMFDPDFVRAESVRLYQEVIADYSDILYIPTAVRDLERKARETPSASITDAQKKQEMIEVERYLAKVKAKATTLGQVAAGRLDNMWNLAVGKIAPDFEGGGVDGKPLKLSDYRGQVVVIVYWFSTCGPCLREIPHERELTKKMNGRPFTLLGVVTDGRGESARKVVESEGMTWPNILSGGDKVAERYHITGNPSYYVVDANGVIRSKGYLADSSLDELIERVVSETETKEKSKPGQSN